MPTSLVRETDVDVLVIGAGPAGLMCANGLAKAGINVRIIDDSALHFTANQSYGLAERIFKEAAQMHMAAFYNPSPNGGIELTDRAPDVTAPTARYPFECTLHQGAIESVFQDSMRSMGVEVGRPIVPESITLPKGEAECLDPTENPVRVVLKHLQSKDGQTDTEIVHAKFVVGADEYIWGVVDLIPDTDFPDIRNKTAIHSTNGSCMIIPREGDKVRLYIQLGDTLGLTNNGRVDMNKMSPQKLLEVAQKSFHPYKISTSQEIDWWTIYVIGQRVASHFSVYNRVFIAGDACHTHSPKAVWKLSYVLRGWAKMSVLDTYEFERRKYAQDLIAFDKKFSALFSGKPRTQEYQDGVSHEEFISAFQTFGGFTSGIGIRYAGSAITDYAHQGCAHNLNIGQRMPPHVFPRAADSRPVELQDLLPSDTRFRILIFAGDTCLPEQQAKLERLADELDRPERFVQRFCAMHSKTQANDAFDFITISAATKWTVRYTDVPLRLRSHWSKVLVDDKNITGNQGGSAYSSWGIDPSGILVVVRPDGYVGMVAPLDQLDAVNAYFEAFTQGL
ncbi:hypothetical protein HGRIS_005108 [Hohenbuehelia grisea]|uniref:Phenol 2-monooxygenase n=1 Tax=Hohenbuehelia grisea TaxID=104357 RepID=A0ABR3JEG9_9AGAR